MSIDRPDGGSDIWSTWLLQDRHGGDPAYERIVRAEVDRYADRVLDAARLAPGMTLADIGTGDGVLAFRAIDRIGPSLRVVLTDISLPLLRHAEARAIQRDVFAQCELVHSAADDLKDIPTASVDAVTTRAVLAYVADKPAALRQFHRILKPGGRISIAEPILQDEAFNAIALKARVDASGPESGDRVLALLHRWKAAQFPDTLEKLAKSPIANYSERDLLRFVNECGFVETHLEFHIDTRPGEIASWETFLGSSPHPWAPTAGTILAQQFTAEEQQILEQMVRPAIESGRSTAIDRVAYVSATKRTVPS